MILSHDEALSLLDDIADSFPPVFYETLHGAVLLLPQASSPPNEPGLFTMGCYCHDQLGRRIELYYGSFLALAQTENWTKDNWTEELRATLAHEFTHHLESLSGERGLEIQDELFMEAYHENQRLHRLPLQRKRFRVKGRWPPRTLP